MTPLEKCFIPEMNVLRVIAIKEDSDNLVASKFFMVVVQYLRERDVSFQSKTCFKITPYYTLSTSCTDPIGHGDGQGEQKRENIGKETIFLLSTRRKGRKVSWMRVGKKEKIRGEKKREMQSINTKRREATVISCLPKLNQKPNQSTMQRNTISLIYEGGRGVSSRPSLPDSCSGSVCSGGAMVCPPLPSKYLANSPDSG